ncbi:MAG: hypothetical protein ABIF92_01005 [archaeon]
MMKTTKTLAILGIVLSVILISGCLGGGDTKGQAGFGEDSLDMYIDTEGRTTFDSEEAFVITLSVENFGPFDVTNVQSRLIGFGGITADSGKLSATVNMSSFLERPRPDLEVPGGFSTKDWDVKAPKVSPDSPDVEILLTGQALYNTKSLANQKVVVAKKEYLVELEQRGEEVPVNPAVEALNGPVSIDTEIPQPYVTLRDTDPSFTVKILLSNDGSGIVSSRDPLNTQDRDYLENITLTVPVGLKIDKSNCDFEIADADNVYTAEKILKIDSDFGTAKKTKLRLMDGGKTRDVSCRLLVDSEDFEGYQTYELYAQTDYTYVQEVVRDITVQGKD